MPRIFDNIDEKLKPALRDALALSNRADFCVGYFNLRGWKQLADCIDDWRSSEGEICRLLIGMQRLPQEELSNQLSLSDPTRIDNQEAIRLKRQLAIELREQLTLGVPNNEDEKGLRLLAKQIKAQQVQVKLFLRYALHAKLYLAYRPDPISPIVAYLGSSNLTLAGLSGQGELNVDVLDHDAATKLSTWFENRWNDRWCIDISTELTEILEQSWAREDLIPPYHIYLKMAYHLAQEAREGLAEFRIPRDFGNKLFEFQTAAVKIAAHHVNKRGGVLIGDVVGLGKTLMASALARIIEEDLLLSTLIICPKNLVKMWQSYVDKYGLQARVLSLSRVVQQLPDIPARFRLVLIDESHNLRNREGKRYKAIQEYIRQSNSRVILLSATPYNKTYLDLSSQLRLFISDEADVGIRPEKFLREKGAAALKGLPLRSLAAFEKSEYTDDWRELMRLYLVRRTRSFIKDNYAEEDESNGRKYLVFEDGTRAYFPDRLPKTIAFDPNEQYQQLYAAEVVDTINSLKLPRYGLGNYIKPELPDSLTETELQAFQNLSRAGKRLMGFCRTNLFKRLESSGQAFLQSIQRHLLRNHIYLYATEQGKPLPMGTQDVGLLDPQNYDEDLDAKNATPDLFDEQDDQHNAQDDISVAAGFKDSAAQVYEEYEVRYQRRFKWLNSRLFVNELKDDLLSDNDKLMKVVELCGAWEPAQDAKLEALHRLLTQSHPEDKIIVFTQFADTVRYLEAYLKTKGVSHLGAVTGNSSDPTSFAWRFSPASNDKSNSISPENELRVLISTDVLSEGQNLQDCAIVVNYDLPWAIIRLVQRAGRVDRIGQKAERILCYSFWPADGIERIIRLRSRVIQRLHENAEVVGADEAFFEDEQNTGAFVDLYHEKAGILDGEFDTDNDLTSTAYEIWKQAITKDPKLEKKIANLPNVVHSTKGLDGSKDKPGVLVYIRTAGGNDALSWVGHDGAIVTESQCEILAAAACTVETSAHPRHEKHYASIKRAMERMGEQEKTIGGQLGSPAGARSRSYERLKHYRESLQGTVFDTNGLQKALDDIYRYPLRESAKDSLNRQLRSGINDADLAELVIKLREDDRLSIIHEQEQTGEPQIICSMGLITL